MDITTASIEVAISTYTVALDAAREERHRINIGELECDNVAFRTEELTHEIIRLKGQIDGMVFAMGEIKAQQQGFAVLEAERNTVLTLDAETLEEIRVEQSIAEHDRQMDAEHA